MKAVFTAVYLIMAAIIVAIYIKNRKSTSDELHREMGHLIISVLVPVLADTLVICAPNESVSKLAHFAFYFSIDIMLFCLTRYFHIYTNEKRAKGYQKIIFNLILAADGVSLFLNYFFGHAFAITETEFMGQKYYVASKLFLPYDIHLCICYVLCAIFLLIIVRKMIVSPGIYKSKYIVILLLILLVLAVDGMSILIHLPINYSVLAYAALTIIIRYYTLIYEPQALRNTTIAMAVQNMDTGIACFDMDGNYVFSNSAIWKIFGREEDHSLAEKTFLDRENTYRLSGKDHYRWNEQFIIKGEPRYLNLEFSKMFDSRHRYIGSYFHIIDNTDDVKSNAAQLKKAEDENRSKSAFVSRLSHEIRTPLNAVYGMNEMIMRRSDDPEIKSYAADIRSSSEMIISIINDVLDFSRIESGKMTVAPFDYSLTDMVRNLHQMMRVQADKKNLGLVFDVSDKIPTDLYGDKNKIQQILVNILSNAIKYTNEGHVRLDINGREDGDDILLNMSVTDTGIGIKKEDIPRLFVAYDRIEEVEHHSIQGTGLGINITVKLLRLMGSELIIDSEYGVGSTFSFTIRQQRAHGTGAASEISRASESADSVQTASADKPLSQDYSHMSALVVDDSATNRKVILQFLGLTKIHTDDAAGGTDGLEKIKNNHYDIIFLDHMMPDMTGIEVYEKLKECSHPNTDTPIVMLTANVVGDTENSYLSMGFDAFLSKPVKPAALDEILKKFLNRE